MLKQSVARSWADNQGKLLSKDELAAWLGVKPRVIDNYIEDRVFPFIKLRNTVRFRREDVEKVLDQLTVREPREVEKCGSSAVKLGG